MKLEIMQIQNGFLVRDVSNFGGDQYHGQYVGPEKWLTAKTPSELGKLIESLSDKFVKRTDNGQK